MHHGSILLQISLLDCLKCFCKILIQFIRFYHLALSSSQSIWQNIPGCLCVRVGVNFLFDPSMCSHPESGRCLIGLLLVKCFQSLSMSSMLWCVCSPLRISSKAVRALLLIWTAERPEQT